MGFCVLDSNLSYILPHFRDILELLYAESHFFCTLPLSPAAGQNFGRTRRRTYANTFRFEFKSKS